LGHRQSGILLQITFRKLLSSSKEQRPQLRARYSRVNKKLDAMNAAPVDQEKSLSFAMVEIVDFSFVMIAGKVGPSPAISCRSVW
jgi:hypothetical protein